MRWVGDCDCRVGKNAGRRWPVLSRRLPGGTEENHEKSVRIPAFESSMELCQVNNGVLTTLLHRSMCLYVLLISVLRQLHRN
jgi:hypothetical protein